MLDEKAIATKLRELADEVDKPKEEWVDVTKECGFEVLRWAASTPDYYLRVTHNGSYLGM